MISDLTPYQPQPVPAPAKARPTLSFAIPPDQAAALSAFIPHDEMQRVRVLLAALSDIHRAPKILPACNRLAAGMHRRGTSAQRLRALYYAYTRGTDTYPAGDWRILLDGNKARIDRPTDEQSIKHRPAFIEFWRKLGEDFHQDWAAAHGELLRIWTNGYDQLGRKYTAIPGYDSWPVADAWLGHPSGWSYANLMRYQSDLYDQVAARIGHAKASAHRLPVLTTRVGLEFGQFIELDDHEFNQRTLFQRRPMRPLGFGAVEILSDCPVHMGFKPTLWDYEAEVKRKLTEREFMWFVVSLLTTFGYRADIGTTLIVERGTAAIRKEFEARLLAVSNDKIVSYVGGRFGKPSHAGQFEGRSKGNYRTKKLVEGFWAMVDNQTAMLPAQTGRGRDDAPEGFTPSAGAEQYTARVFRAADQAGLSAEQIAQLQFPYPTYQQWREWAMDAVNRIARTREHQLEGWDKLGFVQPVWRLPAIAGQDSPWLPWQNFLALPDTQQAVVKSMLDADRSLIKTMRLSRHEVKCANLHLMTKLPLELMSELVGPENALSDPLEVKSGLFRFECAEIDSDPLEFYARDFRSQAFLANGTKCTAYVNPYAPTHLVAYDASGKFVAACPRYVRAVRTDEHAIEKLMGAQQQFEAAARVRLNLRHSDQAAAKQQMLANNTRVLAEVGRGVPTAPPAALDDDTADLLARSGEVNPEEDTW
jgi:hypothetical protein